MRIWSLHPRYLDAKGLVACWRETLLAQAVIAGDARGYGHHPQLERFRAVEDPLGAIGRYLLGIAEEADARAYRFDRSRIRSARGGPMLLEVTTGQLDFERAHLLAKLEVRAPDLRPLLDAAANPDPHPLFRVVEGPRATWERGSVS